MGQNPNPGVGPFVLARQMVDPASFVDFWEPFYAYKKEHLYDNNIRRPLTRESVRELYLWKSGGWFSRAQESLIERAFVERIPVLETLDASGDASVFLNEFPDGGPIWRIFWLHIWQPDRFPIFDQHVYRAMCWIQEGRGRELPSSESGKTEAYLDRFVTFIGLFDGIDRRRTDKALWVCGKRLKPFNTGRLSACRT